MPEIERELCDFMVGWRDSYEESMLRAALMIGQRIEIYDESEGQLVMDYVHAMGAVAS